MHKQPNDYTSKKLDSTQQPGRPVAQDGWNKSVRPEHAIPGAGDVESCNNDGNASDNSKLLLYVRIFHRFDNRIEI